MDILSDKPDSWAEMGHRLANIARAETLPRFRNPTCSVIAKGDASVGSAQFDPVTNADRAAEQAIRSHLESDYPELGFIGEEYGALRPEAEYRWILDPIDGTRSFVSGLPTWTTLLALTRESFPIFGLVDQPYIGERWFNSDDGAHWVRTDGDTIISGHSIGTRPCASLGDACVTATDPRAGAMFSEAEAFGFDALARAARIARFSTDAYGYMSVAMGCMDLVIEAGLHAYDIAAIVPIIRAAGGVITGWAGEPIRFDGSWDGRVVAAGDKRVHEEALSLIATW